MTFNCNSILFRIRSGVDTLTKCNEFDVTTLQAARYIQDNVERFLDHQQALYLFSSALYDTATAQQRLELAEMHVDRLRQQQMHSFKRNDTLESSVVSDAGTQCRERALDSKAERLNLEFRLKQLMELNNADSADEIERSRAADAIL